MPPLSEVARERGIRYFLVSHADLFGVSRAKLVPAGAIDSVAMSGTGFAGATSWLDQSPADPDLHVKVDPASLIQLPWKPEVGWLAADPWRNGEPLAHAPRNVLKRMIAQTAATGLSMKTGVECEFYLLSPDGTALAEETFGQKAGYDQAALMRRFDVVAEICDALEGLGWQPEQAHHEDAAGQFEINWRHDDALATADRHVFFKFMTKAIAERHGLRATFMPKPFLDLAGNGCHVHVSLWRDGANAFDAPGDPLGLSATGRHFIGGLMTAAQELCAITNPTVNSYKRINAPAAGAGVAPNAVTYAGDNRTHMIRVPEIRVPEGGRIEFRLPDGAANPYLLSAVMLAAGLDGVAEALDPGEPSTLNMVLEGHRVPRGTRRLPLNLLDAIRLCNQSKLLRRTLGDELIDAYTKLRMKDWNDHARHLSAWERASTLDC